MKKYESEYPTAGISHQQTAERYHYFKGYQIRPKLHTTSQNYPICCYQLVNYVTATALPYSQKLIVKFFTIEKLC